MLGQFRSPLFQLSVFSWIFCKPLAAAAWVKSLLGSRIEREKKVFPTEKNKGNIYIVAVVVVVVSGTPPQCKNRMIGNGSPCLELTYFSESKFRHSENSDNMGLKHGKLGET